jgi:hypothetical protein
MFARDEGISFVRLQNTNNRHGSSGGDSSAWLGSMPPGSLSSIFVVFSRRFR